MPSTNQPAQANLPPQAGPRELASSIRTMGDDIAKLKVGQMPSGGGVPKPAAPRPVPAPAASMPAPIPTPVRPSPVPVPMPPRPEPIAPAIPRAPLSPAPALPRPTPRIPTPPTAAVSVPPPPSGGGFRRILPVLLIAILLIVGGYILYAYFRGGTEITEQTPTPTGAFPGTTPTPTAAASLASRLNAPSEEVELANTGNPLQDFQSRVATLTVPFQGFVQLLVRTASKGAEVLTARELLDRLLVSYPPSLRDTLGSDSGVFLYGQQEAFDTQGRRSLATTPVKRYVFILEVIDITLAKTAVGQWEPDMPSNLIGIMGTNPAKGTAFADGASSTVPIRYQNFPYPDTSIDYAFVPLNGRTYLVIAGSREAMFSVVEHFLSSSQ